MKTIVTTQIDCDEWFAKTPHQETLEGRGTTESEAINNLVAVVRAWEGPWNYEAEAPSGDGLIVRQLSGCLPSGATPPTPKSTHTPAKPGQRKDVNDE